jgi:hypothetical protein
VLALLRVGGIIAGGLLSLVLAVLVLPRRWEGGSGAGKQVVQGRGMPAAKADQTNASRLPHRQLTAFAQGSLSLTAGLTKSDSMSHNLY